MRRRPGDVLVLYSDGLIEATNAAGEEYGESRLREFLATAEAGSPDEHPRRDPGVGERLPGRGAAPGRPDVGRREVRIER